MDEISGVEGTKLVFPGFCRFSESHGKGKAATIHELSLCGGFGEGRSCEKLFNVCPDS